MSFCLFFETFAKESMRDILTAKHKIDEMIKNKNFDSDQLKETEFILKLALEHLLTRAKDITQHLVSQVEVLINFTDLVFANKSGIINENKLKELSVELEILFQEVVELTI